ncbi:hypothetical protein BpHYR1_043939 [Brachionus plicatilis]|uniref:Uncharacterized protein n=1 Tax=Brachionus plicatilis TaxID=10195 RepID=A0A3M7RKB8_BRAPC|nr:hypothetical protein BpHYR1_043939 [Brachionus plicatilis]
MFIFCSIKSRTNVCQESIVKFHNKKGWRLDLANRKYQKRKRTSQNVPNHENSLNDAETIPDSTHSINSNHVTFRLKNLCQFPPYELEIQTSG